MDGRPDESEWFRGPTRRERAVAAGLFFGFGLFFFALSFVWRGVWFGWVIAGLGVWSVWAAAGHWREWRGGKRRSDGATERRRVAKQE